MSPKEQAIAGLVGIFAALLPVAYALNTGQTASTEVPDVDLALNRIVEHATGAITTQRAVLVRAPTYSFVGASTISDAATVAVTGAPVAGANGTITRSWSLWSRDGAALLERRLAVRLEREKLQHKYKLAEGDQVDPSTRAIKRAPKKEAKK